MAYTSDELKSELRKLRKADRQIWSLLHPESKAVDNYPNISVGYFGLEEWLSYEPESLQRRLPWALARFELAQSNYRRQTLDALTAIRNSNCGKAVLAEIAPVKALKLSIRPYQPDDDEQYGAYSEEADRKRSTALGFKVRNSNGRHHPSMGEGTGEGSPVKVGYTPAMWGPSGSANITGPGTLPDESYCTSSFMPVGR